MNAAERPVQFIRVENEKLYGFRKRNESSPAAAEAVQVSLSSLKELGLYMMLSALLSNPSFSAASGGMQNLLLGHCKNRYFSLHGVWKSLMKKGFLHRTRIPAGLNRFTDYYDLYHTAGKTEAADSFSGTGASNLSVSEGNAYLASVHTVFCPPETDYTMVSYPMLMDSRLSLSAKGLYAILARQIRLSGFCSDAVISKEHLRLLSGEGCNAFDGIFRELRAAGYLTLERTWDTLHHKICYKYRLSPSGTEQTPAAEAPNTDRGTAPVPVQAADFSKASQREAAPSRRNPVSVPLSGASPSFVPPTSVFLQKVRDQIEYDILCADYPKERLDCIVSIIAQHLRRAEEKPGQTVSFGADRLSAAEISDRFLLLDSEDIRFVLDTYRQTVQTTKVYHVRSYLASCLYYAKENLRLSLDVFRSRLPSVPPPVL